MASNGVHHRSGRLARFPRCLFPTHRCVAITTAVEIGLSLIGLPVWLHLAVALLLHVALAQEEP